MDSIHVPLKQAVATLALGSHSYKANIPLDHCYGTTAHGGFLVSLLLATVRTHFDSTLQKCHQPNTYDAHVVFLRPATAAEALLEIEDTKLGSKMSTVRITLSQRSKACVTGFFSNMDMQTESGLTLPTNYGLTPKPVPADTRRLVDGTEPDWEEFNYPSQVGTPFRAFSHVRYYFHVRGTAHPSISDQYLTPVRHDEVFTDESLGSVADLWQRMIINYYSTTQWGTREAARQGARIWEQFESGEPGEYVPYAFPTLSMNLEFKKLLPSEGVKWLFLRARARQIKNGRMDTEVTILDENMELVVLSHQISAVIDLAGGKRREQWLATTKL